MNKHAFVLGFLVVASLGFKTAVADGPSSPNLCPHTANRYLYQDNVSAMNVETKELLRASLITAAQLRVSGRTQGFVFLDDIGNAWVTLATDADQQVKSYFHNLPPPRLMLLSAFRSGSNRPLPEWAHLESCPPS